QYIRFKSQVLKFSIIECSFYISVRFHILSYVILHVLAIISFILSFYSYFAIINFTISVEKGDLSMMRIVAVLLLVIPGFIAAYGIILMRDSLFNAYYPIFVNRGVQFIIGFILFVAGITFVGAFIVHRDRKKQKNKIKRRD